MPTAPPRHCQGCGAKFAGRGYRCPDCRKRSIDARFARRGTTTQRGLGADHRKASAHISQDDPCVICGNPGTEADPITAGHIVARVNGGTNESSNYQPEHRSCGSRKRDYNTERYITLVTGPPCSGKTTYARDRARQDDLILDMDDIARQLGSTKQWHHSDTITAQANQIMWEAMANVAAATHGRAWVIRSAPNPMERRQLAQWLGANQTVVLLPRAEVLLERAQQRPRRVKTVKAVHHWMARYAAAPGDLTLRG